MCVLILKADGLVLNNGKAFKDTVDSFRHSPNGSFPKNIISANEYESLLN